MAREKGVRVAQFIWREKIILPPHGEGKRVPLAPYTHTPTKQMRKNLRESLVKFRGGYMEKEMSILLFDMIVSKAADLLICLSAYFKREKKEKWGDG